MELQGASTSPTTPRSPSTASSGVPFVTKAKTLQRPNHAHDGEDSTDEPLNAGFAITVAPVLSHPLSDVLGDKRDNGMAVNLPTTPHYVMSPKNIFILISLILM